MNLEQLIIDTVSTVLHSLGEDLVNRLQRELISQDKVSSGTLVNTINFNVNGTELTINLQGYAKYVNEGRQPGSFPPPQAIETWIRERGIIPQNMTGDLQQQQRSLAYVIGRKIERDGIPPTNFIDNVVTPKVITDLENKIGTEIENKIEEWLLKSIT